MKRLDGLRIMIAIGSLAIGALHLRLYFDSYQDLPDRFENVGRSFVANAVAGLVAAVIVLVWSHRLAVLAPLLLADATLIAFALSRTDEGVFNFTESGWTPSPDAALTVIVEIVTALLCVVALLRDLRTDERAPA